MATKQTFSNQLYNDTELLPLDGLMGPWPSKSALVSFLTSSGASLADLKSYHTVYIKDDGATTYTKYVGTGTSELAKETSGISDGAVTEAKIAAGAVTEDKLASNSVETAKIKDGAVTSAKIEALTVTDAKIASSAITTDKIASGAVSEAKLDASLKSIINGKVDAVTGKGLSTNDYTTSEKTKLGALPTASELNTTLNSKANLASPTFTGTPTAPTASNGTNTTQIATTAFVTGAVATETNARTNAISAESTARSTADTKLTNDLATEVTARENAVNNLNEAIASGVGTTEAVIQPVMTSSETSTTNGVSAKGIADFVAEQKALTDAQVTQLSTKVSDFDNSIQSNAFFICDPAGNVLAKFDNGGLEIVDVEVKNNGSLVSLLSLINGKVDKIAGKGLSTNDFSDAMRDIVTGMGSIVNTESDSFYITDPLGNIFFSITRQNGRYSLNYYGKDNDMSSDWSGKVIATYGDSVTAYNNGNHTAPFSSSDISDKWGVRVADYLKFSKHYGRGIGGQTYVWGAHGGALAYVDSTGNSPNVRVEGKNYDDYLAGSATIPSGYTAVRGALSSWVRIVNMFPASIKDTIDVVTVMCHNDAAESNLTSLSTTDAAFVAGSEVDSEWKNSSYYSTYGGDYNLNLSIAGAICSTIMKLQAWMPNAIIVLMTPISGRATSGTINVNLTDQSMQILAEVVRNTHKLISVPLIDCYATDGINGLNRLSYISDGIHPGLAAGKKMVARAVIGGLKSIIPNL